MRTIIVRVFEPAPAAGEVDLHGFVEDVERGTRQRFTRATQLLEVIRELAGHGATGPDADDASETTGGA